MIKLLYIIIKYNNTIKMFYLNCFLYILNIHVAIKYYAFEYLVKL